MVEALETHPLVDHRMDALYEHTFDVNNISDAVLLAIDDQFGPLNTETVAQIIHFAKHQLIATREGHNIFVSDENLQNRWPRGGTLGLHNTDSKMVDANTLGLTEKWMRRTHIPYLKKSIPHAAHQDGLIPSWAIRSTATRRLPDCIYMPRRLPSNIP